eukprot:TRINITY_DN456_c0_g1_i1.p1 TRINITY_DN456_c0_g1~~TRINITY_DN456_c0_g1_i1.p1  ORF type:complete len:506 (+),score=50.91 TRINITY_DN456_c0_g1_i1:890-2407(+)
MSTHGETGYEMTQLGRNIALLGLLVVGLCLPFLAMPRPAEIAVPRPAEIIPPMIPIIPPKVEIQQNISNKGIEPPSKIVAFVEGDDDEVFTLQKATILTFAPWIQSVHKASELNGPVPSRFVLVPQAVFLAAPVYKTDYFVGDSLNPVWRVTLMRPRSKLQFESVVNHRKFDGKMLRAPIRRWNSTYAYFSTPALRARRCGAAPPFVHRSTLHFLPLTAELLHSNCSAVETVTFAQDWSLWIPKQETYSFEKTLLREVTCTMCGDACPQSSALPWLPHSVPWLRGCTPVQGIFLDRYYRVPSQILTVARPTDHAALKRLVKQLTLPPPSSHHFDEPCLMIIAHADDEVLWGVKELVDSKPWHIVAVVDTGEWREAEFDRVLALLNATGEIFRGYTDSLRPGQLAGIGPSVRRVLLSRKWRCVVTHEGVGPTDHVQHDEVFIHTRDAWRGMPQPRPRLSTFTHAHIGDLSLTMEHLRLLTAYPSQLSTIEKHFRLWYQRGGNAEVN